MNNFQPPAQAQFQSPQYTQPYTPPTPQQAQHFSQPAQHFSQPAQQAAPQQQGAVGSLAQGWDQGTRSGGHGPFAKFPEQGSVFAGYVARDMVNGDCRQSREPSKDGTGALKFFRKSGQPQFEYVIAVNVQTSAEYPDGKATLATSKYRLHSAVVRAMQEQNYQAGEGLREGDYIEVQRIGDVNSGMGQPGHDFVAKVTRREAITGQAPVQQASAPVAQQVEYAQPVQAPVQTFGQRAVAEVDPTVAPSTAASAPVTPPVQAGEAPAIPGLSPAEAAIVARYHVSQGQV